ncbi:lysis system i-spanin subunit Rz [Arsenophonus endosymbiont of Bemisia tabaci]|uniref:lysis system i-spanin subunit Rz n=1 Tax=Arsenophonus endosymbiont of Bemisia tabaci TaxID=536059 RepID=UPI001769DABA|nr:lysis system i-spanin subunit Rz [Arsenophonus endosymbiont of Bemisia tabaci]CAA2931246.1 hypothetical protein ARSQ2_02398 [Arsenophonus endosymbiont of Bemisia tabaci Q2]
MKLQQNKIDALQKIDIQRIEEMKNAKAKIFKLDDAVRAGTKRLRVNAVCPILKPLPPRADMMKPPHNLVRQLDRIIFVSER